jgi:hypothetical protein
MNLETKIILVDSQTPIEIANKFLKDNNCVVYSKKRNILTNMFARRYRIVNDNYLGFEVQSRRWWWPFWIECHGSIYRSNTHSTIESARKFIDGKTKSKFVEHYNPHI